jgi:hypothetical protein
MAYQALFRTLLSNLPKTAELPSQEKPKKSLRMPTINSPATAVGIRFRASPSGASNYCTNLAHLLLPIGYQCGRFLPAFDVADSTESRQFTTYNKPGRDDALHEF